MENKKVNRIAYGLNLLWTAISAFLAPICFGLVFTAITGHSKGYDYDLGPEKSLSMEIGFFELVVWLALTLPSFVYVIRRTKAKGGRYLLLIGAAYIALAVLCICLIGGWSRYAAGVFNI